MLCIIPVRAGSKRFPKKNLSLLNGKSLLARTIEMVIDSNIFDQILITTDDPDANIIAKQYPITIQQRPDDLAGDTIRVLDVVKHLLLMDDYQSTEEIAVIFVTSPLRIVEDLINAYNIFQKGYDSLLSVTKYSEPPQFALKIHHSNIVPYISYDYFWKHTQKNRLENLYYPNFSIQMCRRNVIFKHNGFLGMNCGYVEIPFERSVDIDTPMDLKLAEFLISNVPSN